MLASKRNGTKDNLGDVTGSGQEAQMNASNTSAQHYH